jgi:hypothetical protein
VFYLVAVKGCRWLTGEPFCPSNSRSCILFTRENWCNFGLARVLGHVTIVEHLIHYPVEGVTNLKPDQRAVLFISNAEQNSSFRYKECCKLRFVVSLSYFSNAVVICTRYAEFY